MKLKVARNKDSDKIIKLIRKCFKDYKNCYLDVENDSPELKRIFTYFKSKKGKFWIYLNRDKVIGCMGYLPHQKNEIEIHKLYIDQKFRKRGLARKLMMKVEKIAKKTQKKKIILWTDTRFKEAHAMYKKLTYKKLAKTRKLNDISNTTEYYFEKKIN